MLVSELIETLKTLPQDKSIFCQVVGEKIGAWNMNFKFKDLSFMSFVQLRISHERLINLPMDCFDG